MVPMVFVTEKFCCMYSILLCQIADTCTFISRLPTASKTRGYLNNTPKQSTEVRFPHSSQLCQEQVSPEEASSLEQAVKKIATESFNRPGTCFFGDGTVFVAGSVYPLPDSLSSCRILKEGGNGIVLKVGLC